MGVGSNGLHCATTMVTVMYLYNGTSRWQAMGDGGVVKEGDEERRRREFQKRERLGERVCAGRHRAPPPVAQRARCRKQQCTINGRGDVADWAERCVRERWLKREGTTVAYPVLPVLSRDHHAWETAHASVSGSALCYRSL